MATKASDSERTPLIRETSPSQDEAALPDVQDEDGNLSTLRGTLICLSIWLLIFILTNNVSLMTTIQSPIATDLGASTEVSWFTSAYLIAITSITPVAGRLCAIFTPRVYLLASICVQACGLLISSQAPSVNAFLAGRVVTGIGSASVTPVAFILVTELTAPRRRGLFFGAINTGYTSGVACGAIIAGALEPLVGWRAVFWLQIPFTLAAALLAFFTIPEPRRLDASTAAGAYHKQSLATKLSQIDYFGVVTIIGAVVLLLYSLSSPKVQITPIVLSVASLVLFVLVEAHWADQPIVPISILRSRGNILTGIATVGVMTARWSVLFYTPTYVLTLRGWSQASAGLTLIPTNLGFGLGGLLAGWLHIRRTGSFYYACIVTCVLFIMSMFAVSWISTPGSNIYGYLTVLFVNGAIVGCLLNYSIAHVLHLTIPATHIIVIPLNAMFRSLSGSFGSSVAGGLFLRTLQRTLTKEFLARGITGKGALIRQLLGSPVTVQKLTGVEREVALVGYETALRTIYSAGGVLAILMLFVQAGVGWTAPDVDKDEEPTLTIASDGNVGQDVLSPVVSREPVAG
ncbi:major facilitator superfamily domain-containing protein [Exophiala viscosa]|uniref:major facilitator superfamily domain-containing protein n=1 Tax=Exophiala viscosa TaxID=2486360 RepID=UPI0021980BD4|nr:major facilitator superfamily domain-containing protein [Exophiala viscosa]